jgi:hypothetical protein
MQALQALILEMRERLGDHVSEHHAEIRRCISLLGQELDRIGDPTPILHLRLEMRLSSRTNARMSWRERAKVTRQQLVALNLHWKCQGKPRLPLPLRVRFTRIGQGLLDAEDNLREAFKALKDEVAEIVGVDDADVRIEWEYRQTRAMNYAVEVDFWHGDTK